ncbi:hypothetical protein Tco_1562568 [Tanacetum coccineum]
MMLNSVLHGPLFYGTIEVDGVTRTKTYEELTDQAKLQDDYDVKAANIVLQGLPPDVYSLVNHHHLSPVALQYYSPQQHSQSYEAPTHHQQYQPLLTPSVPQHAYQALAISQQPQAEFPQLDSGRAVLSFIPGDDPITSLNKAMTFLTTAITSRFPTTNNQLRTSSILRNQATIQDGKVIVQQVQGRHG